MMGIKTVLFLATIINLSWGTGTDAFHRLKRSRNSFILHRCIATAELSRRYRNEDVLNRKTGNVSLHLNQRANVSLVVPENKSSFRDGNLIPIVHNVNINLEAKTEHQTMHYDVNEGRLFKTNIENTPLKTVNIKTVQNVPPIFRRKSLLPEIEQNISMRKINTSQSFIVIKSVV